MDFPSGKCQQSTWVSLDDGEEWKQSGVSHIRVRHREQDDERNAVAPGKRWRVRRGHDGSTARKRTEGHTAFREAGHVAEPGCPNEPTEEHGMWDGGRAARDGETDTEEIRDEEQEEGHQKARAIASPDLPSRREVEDDNLTHLPFRSWRNHFLRGEDGRVDTGGDTMRDRCSVKQGKRKHDVGATDHRGCGQENRKSARTPCEM